MIHQSWHLTKNVAEILWNFFSLCSRIQVQKAEFDRLFHLLPKKPIKAWSDATMLLHSNQSPTICGNRNNRKSSSYEEKALKYTHWLNKIWKLESKHTLACFPDPININPPPRCFPPLSFHAIFFTQVYFSLVVARICVQRLWIKQEFNSMDRWVDGFYRRKFSVKHLVVTALPWLRGGTDSLLQVHVGLFTVSIQRKVSMTFHTQTDHANTTVWIFYTWS